MSQYTPDEFENQADWEARNSGALMTIDMLRVAATTLRQGDGRPDPQLCTFYQVSTFPDLVQAMQGQISQLQQKLKDKRPWENAFPPSPRA